MIHDISYFVKTGIMNKITAFWEDEERLNDFVLKLFDKRKDNEIRLRTKVG